MNNITYVGPQLFYGRGVTLYLTDTNDITIQKNGTNSNEPGEVAEVHAVSISGNLNLVSDSPNDAFFWMWPTTVSGTTENPFFRVEAGADATFFTAINKVDRGFFWIEGASADINFSVGEGASLLLDS